MTRSPVTAPRIFISAAEPSGDLHAASLIKAIQARAPRADFVGIAGPAMREAGCHALFDMTSHSAMLLGILGSLGRASRCVPAIDRFFSRHAVDAAVVIDSPVLHLPVALRAKSHGIPVLYYVAPQLWAWGASRMHRLKARTDRLAVVLPFEEEYFRNLGFDATYVGHPLFDALSQRSVCDDSVSRIKDRGKPVIALLPGSRKHVVDEVLVGQLAVAAAIRRVHPRAHIGISVANDDVVDLVQRRVNVAGVPAQTYRGQNAELLTAADLTLVASGTATLEVAQYGSPMIAMYNGSRWMYQLYARWRITIPHLCLINILADRELIPEFMPYYTSTAPITKCALDLLSSPERLNSMRQELAQMLARVNEPGASARTADILMEMIDSKSH